MDHHCCTTTAVWLQWSCLARHSFPWLSQEMLMCTGKKEHHFGLQPATDFYIWPAGSDLPLYLTCRLWPTIIFDLQALTYHYIWPAGSDLPLYLTCKISPTFIFDLQAEVCTVPCVGHRDPIEPRCSLCGDVGHDDKARGPEHYGLVRPTDTLQSDAVWLRLGAASGVCWRPQEGKGHFRWRWERCDVKADKHWVSVESHFTDIFISSRGACVADM